MVIIYTLQYKEGIYYYKIWVFEFNNKITRCNLYIDNMWAQKFSLSGGGFLVEKLC